MLNTVARVKHLSSKDIKECMRTSTPTIATDMLRSWKASTLWSFDFFKQRYGSDVVTLSDGRFRALTQLPLAQCIDLILRMDLRDTYKYCGATPYIQDWVVLDIHPELYGDIEVPEWFDNWERPFKKTFLPGSPYHDIVVLAGPAGATTYIHRDRHRTHAWLAQIVGRKRWTIFPPDQFSLVYNKDFESGAPPFVNISNPDLENFPGFKDASPIEFVLEPGELVFMPSGWLHQVTSLDPALSVSGNFVNGSNIGVFLKDACVEILENLKQRRKRLPRQLAESLSTLAQTVEGDKLTSSKAGVTIAGSWQGCALRLTGSPDGVSWTLSNYKHGRKYTSFFADRRTDLKAVGLNSSGQAAAQELLSLSPRHEMLVIVGLTTANVSLYGPFLDVKGVNDRVLGALERLTASFALAAESSKTAVSRV
jgi:Cupin-like domain